MLGLTFDAAFYQGLAGCSGVIALCWLLGLATKEHSWVDRLWSITPIGFVAFFAWTAGASDTRLLLMAALAAAWGARLTFNFARKGGYAKGGEDYRWPVLRKRLSPLQWQLFALGFVAGYQNFLLFLLSLPAWHARGGAPLGSLDVVAAVIFLGALLMETVADQQQWNFHQEKKAKVARGEAVTQPFLDHGLFRYSRHPNFFAEQLLWWAFYVFSVAATGAWLNPTILGPALLTLLFHGSTNFTESITLSKYPSYAEYQRRTSRLIPWLPGRSEASPVSARSGTP